MALQTPIAVSQHFGLQTCLLCANQLAMEKLQQFLNASGTRQSALAGTLGITRGYMSELVSGRKVPSLPLAFQIERATAGAVPVDAWRSGADAIPPTTEDAA